MAKSTTGPADREDIIRLYRELAEKDLEIARLREALEPWRGCLQHLLTWRSGLRSTIGEVLNDFMSEGKAAGFNIDEANKLLLEAGVLLLPARNYNLHDCDGPVLAIPNESSKLATLFRGTKWIGSPGASAWKSALRKGSAEILVNDRNGTADNRVRIDGARSRCSLVALGVYYRAAQSK